MIKRHILVFISYVREDYAQVLPIKEGLEKAEIDCWMDVEDIAPGFNWERKIKETINGCDFFIACFSERCNKKRSTYMEKEVQFALTRHHIDKTKSGWIIPVLLSGCFPQLPNTIDVPLRMVQWISFSPNNWHISFDRLLSTINPEAASRGIGLNELERRFTEGKTNDRIQVLKMLSNVLDLPEALSLLEMGLMDPQESVRITNIFFHTEATTLRL